MSTLLAAPLLLALLTAASTPSWPLSEEWDTSGARHLELTAENAREQHPVRISPGHPTNLVFVDTPLQPGGVKVEGGTVAVAVNGELGMVMLMPPSTLPEDQPLTVTVHFADGLVPGSVTFRLVVHATRAEHHVRVYRETRSCESTLAGGPAAARAGRAVRGRTGTGAHRPGGAAPRGLHGPVRRRAGG